jgi:prophage regulatory protein
MEVRDAVLYTDDHLLRIDDLVGLTTLSKSCINLWVAKGKFPKPLILSKTVKVWRMSEVRKWLDSVFVETGDCHE